MTAHHTTLMRTPPRPAWTRPTTPARTRDFLDALQVLTRLGGLVTANHLATGLVVELGLDVFGLEVSDVLHAMNDTSLARTADALRRPIRFRVEHDNTTTRGHACGVRAEWFLAAMADRYGVEPFITAAALPLHHRPGHAARNAHGS